MCFLKVHLMTICHEASESAPAKHITVRRIYLLGPQARSPDQTPGLLAHAMGAAGPRASAEKTARQTRCRPHVSSWRAASSRAPFTRQHRQNYARLYPVRLVRQDGSTIHIHYREPRRILAMPLDLDSRSPEEQRARFRKLEVQLRVMKEEEPVLGHGFDAERYKRFWTKK
ncbi:39S ribosomal protein L55, mitochondrial-like [Talpa occidentalis]|uniref:39S ribosomal protein L55, mitochondrial-like n=1 Tax=Talpa occidentalis TaxID=50954 RepID=UPI00188DC865|nr:39S ribosomal protein L55, mitochondrial-like [Talpa occidentalis]